MSAKAHFGSISVPAAISPTQSELRNDISEKEEVNYLIKEIFCFSLLDIEYNEWKYLYETVCKQQIVSWVPELKVIRNNQQYSQCILKYI